MARYIAQRREGGKLIDIISIKANSRGEAKQKLENMFKKDVPFGYAYRQAWIAGGRLMVRADEEETRESIDHVL